MSRSESNSTSGSGWRSVSLRILRDPNRVHALDSPTYHAYADETDVPAPAGSTPGRCVGAAVFITDEPVRADVVKEAMSALAPDPDRSKPARHSLDMKTLSNGYFHASCDSANSHSHFARSIKKHLNGILMYALFEIDKLPDRAQLPSTGGLQSAALNLAARSPLEVARQVDFVIERRNNQGGPKGDLANRLGRLREQAIFYLPLAPTPFPCVSVEVKDKTDPGLQVVDFLLWAMNRRRGASNDPWCGRVGLAPVESWKDVNGPRDVGMFSLGENQLHFPLLRYPSHAKSLPEWVGEDAVRDSLYIIEQTIAYWRGRLPSHAVHLNSALDSTVCDLERSNHETDRNMIVRACSLFLRLFDTVPVYSIIDDDDACLWHRLLGAKTIAAHAVHEDLCTGIELAGYLAGYRRGRFTNP